MVGEGGRGVGGGDSHQCSCVVQILLISLSNCLRGLCLFTWFSSFFFFVVVFLFLLLLLLFSL